MSKASRKFKQDLKMGRTLIKVPNHGKYCYLRVKRNASKEGQSKKAYMQLKRLIRRNTRR